MLNSCAPGITVVNIDNGFGAAYSVHRIALTSNTSDFTARSRSA
jgi:NCAIR mutase (PurE)-related protein